MSFLEAKNAPTIVIIIFFPINSIKSEIGNSTEFEQVFTSFNKMIGTL